MHREFEYSLSYRRQNKRTRETKTRARKRVVIYREAILLPPPASLPCGWAPGSDGINGKDAHTRTRQLWCALAEGTEPIHHPIYVENGSRPRWQTNTMRGTGRETGRETDAVSNMSQECMENQGETKVGNTEERSQEPRKCSKGEICVCVGCRSYLGMFRDFFLIVISLCVHVYVRAHALAQAHSHTHAHGHTSAGAH